MNYTTQRTLRYAGHIRAYRTGQGRNFWHLAEVFFRRAVRLFRGPGTCVAASFGKL